VSIPIPVGISLAAPLERVHTFRLKGTAGLRQLSTSIEADAADPAKFEADLTTVQLGAIGVDSLIATPFTANRTVAKIRDVPLDAVAGPREVIQGL
jgi:hypothetical protein